MSALFVLFVGLFCHSTSIWWFHHFKSLSEFNFIERRRTDSFAVGRFNGRYIGIGIAVPYSTFGQPCFSWLYSGRILKQLFTFRTLLIETIFWYNCASSRWAGCFRRLSNSSCSFFFFLTSLSYSLERLNRISKVRFLYRWAVAWPCIDLCPPTVTLFDTASLAVSELVFSFRFMP